MSAVADFIDKAREEIDAIDSEIRDLIAVRNDHVAALISYKIANGLPVWDQRRVDDIIDKYIEELGDAVDGIMIASAIIGTREQLETLNGD